MDQRESSVAGLDMSQDWAGRRVLLTGHTGFKGSWLAHWLLRRGADVYGLSLEPEGTPNLFDALHLSPRLNHAICDIRNAANVRSRVQEAEPDVVFHLAAQPLVRRSYREPQLTMETNVMGTVNLLEALRGRNKPTAVVIVTTDKVYENPESLIPCKEDDPLGGHDTYSASKAAAEIATASYRSAFFSGSPVRVATARAGNVIGGGDWADDRILPDLARSFSVGESLVIRNPGSIRPWQHVLEPLKGYIDLASGLLAGDQSLETAFNFGPLEADQRAVQDIVSVARSVWPGSVHYETQSDAPHEAGRLTLSIDKVRSVLGWSPQWDFDKAVLRSVSWYREYYDGKDARQLVDADIDEFEAGTK